VVRVPSVSEEADRSLHRQRDRLTNERIEHVNRIKGLCAFRGINHYGPMWRGQMRRLEQVRTEGDARFRRDSKQRLHAKCSKLELVLAILKEIEAERVAMVSAKKLSTRTNAKKAPGSRQTQANRTGDCDCIGWRSVLPTVSQSARTAAALG
jgi:transposase